MAGCVLCISIDCECDKGPGWRTRSPLGFRGITDGIARRLQPLFERYAAKPTYLLSPEVVDHPESAECLAGLRQRAELGTHLHGEFAPPDGSIPETTAAFQRDYPPEVEREKLAYITRRFEQVFAERPRSFRAGRFGIGPHSLGALDELGYEVDSSVTPHVDWADVGAKGLSFVGAPEQPYHPDPATPARAGSSRLWEIPVTILPSPLARLPVVGKRVEARWLRPTKTGPRALVQIAKDAIARARAFDPGRTCVLNAMFHNVEIVEGLSPYADTPDDAAKILARLEALLAFANAESIPVVGLADVPERLE